MNDTAWNLESLRRFVDASIVPADQAHQHIRSLDYANRIFHYHFLTARDALLGLIDEQRPYANENIALVFGTSLRQAEYSQARVVSEANTIACLHTTRSIVDIFSHLLNSLLLQNTIALDRCDIRKATKALQAGDLKQQLQVLLASHWLLYVEGFINTTKHRQLVHHNMSISTGANRAGMRIDAFSYREIDYPEYWAVEALQGAADVKSEILSCGRLLNRICIGDALPLVRADPLNSNGRPCKHTHDP